MIENDKTADSLAELAAAAFRATARDVIERAKRHGTDLILWKDGRVVRVSPHQFEGFEQNEPPPRES
ncbi:MAG TPA: hypothetical protein VMM56_14130 [Planctomycetaceae bacterium]|nr:hypothetical protein [Planctomycetaceae bacterium]